MKIEQIKSIIQSAHINFLIGSGVSRPYLNTLGSVETWLTELSNNPLDDEIKNDIVKCSILNEYLTGVIIPNLEKVINDNYDHYKNWIIKELIGPDSAPTKEEEKGISLDNTINEYKLFLQYIHSILARRGSNLRNKTANLFTTNIDILLEFANQGLGIELNDGFSGRKPSVYDDNSFSKQATKVGLHSQKASEIPTINYIKLHGSINWSEGDEHKIIADDSLKNVVDTQAAFNEIKTYLIDIQSQLKAYNNLDDDAEKPSFVNFLLEEVAYDNANSVEIKTKLEKALSSYSKIIMVNPTKRKFRETVMDMPFYELMRFYSNSLERENCVLFVSGFSFADEHLAKITLRAAANNPTLSIIIFAYDDKAKNDIEKALERIGGIPNKNILCLSPLDYKKANENEESSKIKIDNIQALEHFDMKSINDFLLKPLILSVSKLGK